LIRKRFDIHGVIAGLRDDIAFLGQRRKLMLPVFASFAVSILIVVSFFPVYWSFDAPKFSAEIPHGMTEDGHPWIGAENPKLRIIAFADYQCFQCNKMHFFLRQTLAKYPDRIQVIHRHFPMDHEVNPLLKEPEHIGSGKLAMLAIYAATQNRFWQMNDILFSIARVNPEIDIKKLARDVGLDEKKLSRAFNSRDVRIKLKKDIYEGIKLGVRGTPSFVIDGQVYQGQIPSEILKKALE
jgi:protein-disulfide isomerase